jgi:5-methylcytosine-specific restriction enzyme A
MNYQKSITGKLLNLTWHIGARHALYREDGRWYHRLLDFPGVYFDSTGYIIFNSEEEYLSSTYLDIKHDVHVKNGISEIPGYKRIVENKNLLFVTKSVNHIVEEKAFYNLEFLPEGRENPQTQFRTIKRVNRETKVGYCVKYLHQFQCQICGIKLELNEGKYYAETHHIKPLGKAHHGPDVVENIICVCPNHHALLDYGAIPLDGNSLFHAEGHIINDDYINYHNTVIYNSKI